MIEQILNIGNYGYSSSHLPTLFTSAATILMGFYVLVRLRLSKIGLTFFEFTATIALWHVAFYIAYCAKTPYIALWWFRIGLFGVVMIPIANYSFITSLLRLESRGHRFLIAGYFISIALACFTVFSSYVAKGVKSFFWGYYPQFDILGVVVILFYVPMLANIFLTLWKSSKEAITSHAKKRMRWLLYGLLIGYTGAVDFTPTFDVPLYPIGYFPVLIFVAIWTFVTIRYRLVDITPQTAASQILQTMRGGLIVVDMEERIKIINNDACIMFGYSEEEMIDLRLNKILALPAELRDCKSLSLNPIKNHQLSFVNIEGKTIFLSISASVLGTKDIDPTAIVYVMNDITKHKALEAALEESKNTLEMIVHERTAELSETVDSLRNEIAERKRMENALVTAAEQWRTTFDSTKEMIFMVNSDFEIIRANKAAINTLELTLPAAAGEKIIDARGFYKSFGLDEVHISLAESKSRIEKNVEFKEKGLFLILSADPILDADKNLIGAVLIARDITDIKKSEEIQSMLQEQLLQAQKMESIGRFTGGIAHDFNNILCAILGYAELATYQLPEDHPSQKGLKTINEAGHRAARLIRQLLAFSRKQILEIEVINPNSVIEEMNKILARLIGEDIKLILKTVHPIKCVMADRGQLEQILLNLSANARDAMPKGGKLTIETSIATVDENMSRMHEGLACGEYVVLSVSDDGEGMTQEVQKKIFEPFFTTKAVGKGTGLGLATVYGIVKQHNGYINVTSEVGKETTFNIYLPAVQDSEMHASEKYDTLLQRGTERILVVDDEEVLRQLLTDSLGVLGYDVIQASSPQQALAFSSMFDGEIDLLLTDVIMPGMDGKQLADMISAERKDIKVLFLSGYNEEILAHHGILDEGIEYLQKPVTPKTLSKKVRQVLDAKDEIATTNASSH